MHLRSDGSAALLVVGKADLDEAADVSGFCNKVHYDKRVHWSYFVCAHE